MIVNRSFKILARDGEKEKGCPFPSRTLISKPKVARFEVFQRRII
jgi:hypothetical protein